MPYIVRILNRVLLTQELVFREREQPPRFAQPGSFEYEYAMRWKALIEMEKQQQDQVDRNIKEAYDKWDGDRGCLLWISGHTNESGSSHSLFVKGGGITWYPDMNHSGSCHTTLIAEELDSIQGIPKGSLLNSHLAVLWKVALRDKDTKSFYGLLLQERTTGNYTMFFFILFFPEERIVITHLGHSLPFLDVFNLWRYLFSCTQNLT